MALERSSSSGVFLNGMYMGNCQNYGTFLGPYNNTGPNLGDPKRDHNFDNLPYVGTFTYIHIYIEVWGSKSQSFQNRAPEIDPNILLYSF